MRMRKTNPTLRIEQDDLWITEARRQIEQLKPSKAPKRSTRGLLASIAVFLVLLAVAALSGCADEPEAKPDPVYVCDTAIPIMTQVSRSVTGTKTVTEITNAQGLPIAAIMLANGFHLTVGDSLSLVLLAPLASAPRDLSLVMGPTNGECLVDMALTFTDTPAHQNASSPYMIYFTAIWPATVEK